MKATGEDRHHDLGAQVGAVVSGEGNMKLTDQQACSVKTALDKRNGETVDAAVFGALG